MSDKIRIVIADDHPLIREGLASEIDARDDVTVVATAATGAAAVEAVQANSPQVLLIDIELPDQTGVDVARTLRQSGSEVYIIALSSYNERRYVYGMIDIGANGYLLKQEATYDAVYEAIKGVVENNGDFWMSPSFAEKLVRFHISERRALQNLDKLSSREEQVMKLVAEGYDNQAVADVLHISPNTVKNHIDSVKDKLSIRTRAELIAWAWRHNVVKETDWE